MAGGWLGEMWYFLPHGITYHMGKGHTRDEAIRLADAFGGRWADFDGDDIPSFAWRQGCLLPNISQPPSWWRPIQWVRMIGQRYVQAGLSPPDEFEWGAEGTSIRELKEAMDTLKGWADTLRAAEGSDPFQWEVHPTLPPGGVYSRPRASPRYPADVNLAWNYWGTSPGGFEYDPIAKKSYYTLQLRGEGGTLAEAYADILGDEEVTSSFDRPAWLFGATCNDEPPYHYWAYLNRVIFQQTETFVEVEPDDPAVGKDWPISWAGHDQKWCRVFGYDLDAEPYLVDHIAYADDWSNAWTFDVMGLTTTPVGKTHEQIWDLVTNGVKICTISKTNLASKYMYRVEVSNWPTGFSVSGGKRRWFGIKMSYDETIVEGGSLDIDDESHPVGPGQSRAEGLKLAGTYPISRIELNQTVDRWDKAYYGLSFEP